MGVGAGLYMYDVVVKKFTFAVSSPDEFLSERAKNSSRTFASTAKSSPFFVSQPHGTIYGLPM